MPYYIIPPKFDIEAMTSRALELFYLEFDELPKALAVDFNEEVIVADKVKLYTFDELTA